MIFPKPYIRLGKKVVYTHRTPDEQEELEQRRAEARLKKQLRQEQKEEVKYFAKAIPTWLAKMGLAYWYKKSEKDAFKGNFNPVKFDYIQIGEDAYYFRINTRRLPRRVKIPDLYAPETLETLSAACGSEVRFHQGASGTWYAVETRYGRGNIPAMVGYAEMLKMLPADAPPLMFPLGMGENQRPYFGDMAKMINLLIGGTKGGGKSNSANVMLCTILPRNHPNSLRIFLTDLKGGIEFADYNGVPHLGGDVSYIKLSDPNAKKPKFRCRTLPKNHKVKGDEDPQPPPGQTILTEPQEVIPVLAYIEAELDRRAQLLAGKAKKIETYNKRYPDKALSYWLVVIDELATLMENPAYKKQATLSLSEIARKGRAVGIFLVLATQTPTSSIVPQQIANNMDSRLAFRCGNGVASGILLGSGEYDAARLPNVPGRYIWKWGGEKFQMQAPFIVDSTVTRVIRSVRNNEWVDARDAELAQKAEHIFTVALNALNGECQSNRLYKFVKPDGVKKSDVAKVLERYELKDENGPEITINDTIYYLVPHLQPKRIARWLVPVVDVRAGRHPHPDFDYGLVSGFPFPISGKPAVSTNGAAPEPDGQILNSENSPANGSRPPEAATGEPLAGSEDDAGEIADDDPAWQSQWHYLDERSLSVERRT